MIRLHLDETVYRMGEDFGDAICKAVNCGWDKTAPVHRLHRCYLDAIWIILGRKGLPEKWVAPR